MSSGTVATVGMQGSDLAKLPTTLAAAGQGPQVPQVAQQEKTSRPQQFAKAQAPQPFPPAPALQPAPAPQPAQASVMAMHAMDVQAMQASELDVFQVPARPSVDKKTQDKGMTTGIKRPLVYMRERFERRHAAASVGAADTGAGSRGLGAEGGGVSIPLLPI